MVSHADGLLCLVGVGGGGGLTSQTTESTSTMARSRQWCRTDMPQSLYGGYSLRNVLNVCAREQPEAAVSAGSMH